MKSGRVDDDGEVEEKRQTVTTPKGTEKEDKGTRRKVYPNSTVTQSVPRPRNEEEYRWDTSVTPGCMVIVCQHTIPPWSCRIASGIRYQILYTPRPLPFDTGLN